MYIYFIILFRHQYGFPTRAEKLAQGYKKHPIQGLCGVIMYNFSAATPTIMNRN